MANSTQVLEAIRTITSDKVSSEIVDTTFDIMPTVSFIIGRDGTKNSFRGFGAPSGGFVTGAANVKGLNKETVLNGSTYRPVLVTGYPSTSLTKTMGQHDTVPLMSNADTDTTESYLARPFFRYTEKTTPLLVWNRAISQTRASTRGENPEIRKAISSLFTFETSQKLKSHLKVWNDMFWTGTSAPSNVDNQDLWDSQYSFLNACKSDNSYAGVDRSLAANAYFRGHYISTQMQGSLQGLCDYVRFDSSEGTYRLGNRGGKKLVVVGVSLFQTFLAEARGKQNGMEVVTGSLLDMPRMGHKNITTIKVDDEFSCICDPSCPTAGVNGVTYNAALVMTPETWTVAVRPEKNFSVDDWFDLRQIEGGKDAKKSQLTTELLLACEAPVHNYYFNRVGA